MASIFQLLSWSECWPQKVFPHHINSKQHTLTPEADSRLYSWEQMPSQEPWPEFKSPDKGFIFGINISSHIDSHCHLSFCLSTQKWHIAQSYQSPPTDAATNTEAHAARSSLGSLNKGAFIIFPSAKYPLPKWFYPDLHQRIRAHKSKWMTEGRCRAWKGSLGSFDPSESWFTLLYDLFHPFPAQIYQHGGLLEGYWYTVMIVHCGWIKWPQHLHAETLEYEFQ